MSLTVRDVEKSIEFYSKGLGMKLLRESIVHPTPETKYKNAYMYSDHFLLELVPAEDSASQRESLETFQKAMRGSIGIAHLGVRVRDINSAVARMKAAGATMIEEPHEVTKDRLETVFFAEGVDPSLGYVRSPDKKPWRVVLFSDPDGVTIELTER